MFQPCAYVCVLWVYACVFVQSECVCVLVLVFSDTHLNCMCVEHVICQQVVLVENNERIQNFECWNIGSMWEPSVFLPKRSWSYDRFDRYDFDQLKKWMDFAGWTDGMTLFNYSHLIADVWTRRYLLLALLLLTFVFLLHSSEQQQQTITRTQTYLYAEQINQFSRKHVTYAHTLTKS